MAAALRGLTAEDDWFRWGDPEDCMPRRARVSPEDPARFVELDEQIRQGWGDTPGLRIPPDWRQRRGPDRSFTREQRARVSAGLSAVWRARNNRESFSG